MMRCLLLAFAALLGTAAAQAQPVDLPIPAATTDRYPPGVKVRQTAAGPVYTDAKGRTLYGLDLRTVLRWSPNPAQYCQQDCQALWQPMLAPATVPVNLLYPRAFGDRAQPPPPGAPPPPPGPAPLPPGFHANQRAPDWTVIAGASGPQWVYKGWHMVFVRRGDKPGATSFDGADEQTWNTLKFVPPVPQLVAPGTVASRFVDGGYVLVDTAGHTLFTGTCAADCAQWQPLAGAMASAPVGQWAIDRSGDTAHWRYRGKPVYVSRDEALPAGGKVLRP
jgi:predicted lipoprotein with Yx(FWY)xxD motif